MQTGNADLDSVRYKIQKLLENVVKRLETELNDDESVVLMIGRIGMIKSFLLPSE